MREGFGPYSHAHVINFYMISTQLYLYAYGHTVPITDMYGLVQQLSPRDTLCVNNHVTCCLLVMLVSTVMSPGDATYSRLV